MLCFAVAQGACTHCRRMCVCSALLTHHAQLAHPPRPAGCTPHLTCSCGVQHHHGSALLDGATSLGLATARAVGQRRRSAAQAAGTGADAGARAISLLRKTPGFEPLRVHHLYSRVFALVEDLHGANKCTFAPPPAQPPVCMCETLRLSCSGVAVYQSQ